MLPGGSSRACWALVSLGLLAAIIGSPIAAADEPPRLRVTVSTSGRAVLDTLLNAIATRAGLTGQLAVSYAQPLTALRDLCRNEPRVGPDIALVTRRMQAALAAECTQNGADNVAAVELARDPLILAVRSGSLLTSITSREVYLAVAREVPFRDEFVRNTAARWSDIDPALPAQDIHFQVPMRDEGNRTTFDMLVLQVGCRNESAVKQIFDASKRTAQCTTIRSDRVREIPRAQAMKTLLEAPLGTVGVLSQHELAHSSGQFIGLALDGVAPTPEAIQNGSYDFSTSFLLYAKRSSGTDPLSLAVERIVTEAASDAVIGPSGPLTGLGLAPLTEPDRADQQETLMDIIRPYSVTSVLDWIGDTAAVAWQMFGVRSAQSMAAAAQSPPMTFTTLMDIAGYEISNVQSTIGIIPGASMTFGLTREMSDADHDYLQRVLRRDALARPSAVSAMQRRIIRSIMDVQEVGGFEVSKVEIDFLPLPSVSLQVTPKGASAPPSSDSISAGSE